MDNIIMHEQLTINEQNPIIARLYDYDHFSYPWHFHSEYEIIYVKESHGERFVADSVEVFNPGDVILLGSNLHHYMRSHEIYYKGDPGLRVKGVVIQFAHDYMAHAIHKYADFTHIKSLLNQAKRGFYFPHPQNSELIQRIEALPRQSGIYRIIDLLLLLDKMAAFKDKRFMGSPHFSENTSEYSGNRIEKILSFLNYHYTENISLNDMSSRFSMNATAFCRYFKQYAGKSYIDYIQDLRIGYACKLLIGTSYDISQISIECGYNTACHFNKIFKRKTALTPSEYRNKFIR
ncbi:MAG: AraC family transcriptional regulator [Tannerella sp.]|jgi:AraC-like DNA-binding protein|nr:AraC family transcriptional regulator [Tannerella sp.]